MRSLCVAAIGKSVFLTSIATALAQNDGLTVGVIDPSEPDARPRIRELAPDAMVFENDTAFLSLPISLLLEHPNLVVVLDRHSTDMLVLSGQRTRATTVDGFVELLTSMMGDPAPVE